MKRCRPRELTPRPDHSNPVFFRIPPVIPAILIFIISVMIIISATPVDASPVDAASQIIKERDGINFNWIRIRESLLTESAEQPHYLPRAKSFTGRIVLKGEQQVLTGDEKGMLAYSLVESFSGNIINMYLYDPSSDEFSATDQAMINTLSTGIELKHAEFTSSDNDGPGKEEKGEHMTGYIPHEDEVFPGFHSEVIRGSTQGADMELEIRSPKLIFPKSSSGIFLDRYNSYIRIPLQELENLSPGKALTLHRRIQAGNNRADLEVTVKPDTPLIGLDLKDGDLVIPAVRDNGTGRITAIGRNREPHGGGRTYRFLILGGRDKISFPGGKRVTECSLPETDVEMLEPSSRRKDVILEVECVDREGNRISGLTSLTMVRPQRLDPLETGELEEMGYTPFIDYRELLLEGRPVERNMPGKKGRKIREGYSRVFAYRILDQFGSPIREEGLKGESRLLADPEMDTIIKGSAPVPELMGFKKSPGPENIFTREMITGNEGIMEDRMDLPIFNGSGGIPPHMTLEMEQEIYLMGWLLGKRKLRFTEMGVESGVWRE